MTTDQHWRGVVNEILYGLIGQPSLDDRVVNLVAGGLVASRRADRGPDVYHARISEALAAPDPLTGAFELPHDETGVRDFLHRLRARLEALRPWPEPPFRVLPVAGWSVLDQAGPIATIASSVLDLQPRLRASFQRLAPDDPERGLLLRLPSGEVVGLRGALAGGRDQVTLFGTGTGDPVETIAAFCAATGLSADEVRPAGDGARPD